MIRSFIVVGLLSIVFIAGQPAAADQAKPEQTKPGATKSEPTKPDPPKAQSADASFMREAAMANLAEIEHGQLAAQNASADEVKKFGARMATDHGKANEELKTIATTKSVTLPTELDQKHQAMQDKLTKLKGEAFDKGYMSHMVTAHEQSLARFKRESQNGKDPEAKAFAAKVLPTVEEHLKMVRELNTKLVKPTR